MKKVYLLISMMLASTGVLALSFSNAASIQDTIFESDEIFVGTVTQRNSIRKKSQGKKGPATRIKFKGVHLINEKGLDRFSGNKFIEIPGGVYVKSMSDKDFEKKSKNKDMDEFKDDLISSGIEYGTNMLLPDINFDVNKTYIVLLKKLSGKSKRIVPFANLQNAYFVVGEDGLIYDNSGAPIVLNSSGNMHGAQPVFDQEAVDNQEMVNAAAAQGDILRAVTGARTTYDKGTEFLTLDEFVNFVIDTKYK